MAKSKKRSTNVKSAVRKDPVKSSSARTNSGVRRDKLAREDRMVETNNGSRTPKQVAVDEAVASNKNAAAVLAAEPKVEDEEQLAVTTANGFEVIGIERVPENARQHTKLLDTMWLWWTADTVIATVALGTLSFYYGLGFWGSAAVILVFNLLAALVIGFLSTWGPKTGLAQMALGRFAFGYWGAKLPALFNALSCVGWTAVNSALGASLLTAWSGGKIPAWVGVIIIVVLTCVVSLFGYFIVHSYSRIAWIPIAIVFAIICVMDAQHFNINVPVTVSGGALVSSVLTFGGAVFGYAIGWASYAADYTRHQPVTVSRSKVFWYSFLGILVANVVLEILGVLLITPLKGNTLPDAGSLVTSIVGNGALGSIIILLLGLSIISNNAPTDYSFALSSQVVGARVPRWVLTIIGMILYTAVGIFVSTNLNFNLEGFLLMMAYWLGAFSAIVIIEHILRKGQYNVEDYLTPGKLPLGAAAVIALIVALVIAALGINQASVIGYEGPLSHMLSDADIGFPLAVVAAVVIYTPLRLWERQRTGR
ncbi:cytosine permease [Dictyobacter sp. S3.2.2.5]|uniref:Cytosine permease n=1 Tax=Dictyobacter halimunensis TaxID=3026934 RepID=A0ABQ6FIF9_9CHLR|nr:cytosine permease [Dictyobacter sp. S3.2.2.5]